MPDEKDEKKDDKQASALDGLNKAIAGLPDTMKAAVATGVNAALRAEAARREEENLDDEPDEPDEPSSDDDLEKMSRSEFANHISQTVMKAVGKVAKENEKRTDELSLSAQKERLQGQLAQLKSDHPDYVHFKDPMEAIAKTHPFLSPEEIYTLARARSPDIVEKLSKESEEAKGKDEKEKKEKDQKQFAGFTPTSMVGSDEKTGRMTQKDATAAAWDEAMAGLPPELIGNA